MSNRLKKILVSVAVVLAVLAIAFTLGPRVEIDTTIRPAQIPTDDPLALDPYLSRAEGHFGDLKEDVEKTVIWADPERPAKTRVALVYVHGFSATRQETAPLSDLVAARLRANLFYTRLTGHGRSDEAMEEGSVNKWLNDTHEAIAIGKQLGEQVVVIGSSTGASLLTWLAAHPQHGKDISALVLLSPNFGPVDSNSELLLWPWGKQIAQLVVGRYREWTPSNPRHGQFWTHRYPVGALLPMMGVVKIVREANLDAVKAPLLILYSKRDTVASPARTEEFFGRFGSQPKELVDVTPGDEAGHVLAGDILSPGTTETLARSIVDFLKPVLNASQ